MLSRTIYCLQVVVTQNAPSSSFEAVISCADSYQLSVRSQPLLPPTLSDAQELKKRVNQAEYQAEYRKIYRLPEGGGQRASRRRKCAHCAAGGERRAQQAVGSVRSGRWAACAAGGKQRAQWAQWAAGRCARCSCD